MKIIPAILCNQVEDCLRMLRQAASFTDYVQIDVMDGVFVPSRSFPAEEISTLDTSISFEIHLMVEDPLVLMKRVSHPHLKRVIFHVESQVNPLDFIQQMRERGMATGLAVNPDTSIHAFREFANQAETLLFLTVDPGYYGSPFRPDVLEKIEETRQLFPKTRISVDGGVSLENLGLLLDRGVDAACVGSRIFLGEHPGENYQRFTEKVKELKASRGKGSRPA